MSYEAMINLLILLGIIILAWSLVMSFVIRRRRQGERDDGVDGTVVKHPVTLNPIFLAYAIAPILVAIGAAVFYYWYAR